MGKETIIQLFLAQQEQLENIDRNLQLVLEPLTMIQAIYREEKML